MKANKALVIIFCLAIGIGSACDKSDEVLNTNDLPVIEAYISPNKVFSFLVKQQIPFDSNQNLSGEDIEDLEVFIFHDQQAYQLSHLDTGLYVDSSLRIPDGDEFSFSFMFNGKEVSGITYIPTKPLILSQSATTLRVDKIEMGGGLPGSGTMPTRPDPVEITWENLDASYHLIIVENMEEDPEPIREFDDSDSSFQPPNFRFRKSPTTAGYEALNSNEFEYFGRHRVILFHVLPDYAALYDNVSTSSQNLSNPSTNIANGYGIFTGLNSDTIFLNVVEN